MYTEEGVVCNRNFFSSPTSDSMRSAQDGPSRGVSKTNRRVFAKAESGRKHTLKVYKLLQVKKRWDKCSASGKDQMQQKCESECEKRPFAE